MPPTKPFPNYKWRWASLTPSEGLNAPPVYLGVLRVYANHQGEAPSAPSVVADLMQVEHETAATVDLVRTPVRNLKRNSGQYWTALGLLEPEDGSLHVTEFGQAVASGTITPGAFAATVISSLSLPNKQIEEDTDDWEQVNLTIKPLQLILKILEHLAKTHGPKSAKLTTIELVKIVIPLAGAKAQISEYVDALIQYRRGQLSLEGWPDCAPRSNDMRMAREFLLFLSNYGFCNVVKKGNNRYTHEYYLAGNVDTQPLITLPTLEDPLATAKQSQLIEVLADIERQRVLVSILQRPQQARFRQDILKASGGKCVVTGVQLRDVLEAAHIKPVSDGGNDDVSNGFCMRTDIHTLFDTGHLRIDPSGTIHLSPEAHREPEYAALPDKIIIPSYVQKAYVDWRWKYT